MNYIVQPGDSLYDIAMQNNITVNQLMDLNPRISDPNRIYVGERLEVGSQWSVNPWAGNEWQKGIEEYQKGIEEYQRGRAEYRRGRAEYRQGRRHHGR